MILDAGLQPERTVLAWTRTCASLVGGTLVGLKLVPAEVGGWATAPCVAVLGAAVTVGVLARRRADHVRRALLADQGVVADGRLLLGLATLVAAAAGLAVLVVVRVAGVG